MGVRTLSLALALLLPALPAAAAQSPKSSLEARVQRVEDELQIQKMLVLYGRYLDARDWDGYTSLFAQDGEWIGGFGRAKGAAQIKAMLEKQIGPADPAYVNKQSYHLISNRIVTVNGDRATATSMMLYMVRSPENRPTPAIAGHYVDDFVRENGQWKIQRRMTHGRIPYRDGNNPNLPPPPVMPPMGQDQ
jgi:3-phenylpropionate/cinnamic acid dioxygenase small subunit